MAAEKLGFGLVYLPLKDQNDPADIDLDAVSQMVDAFLGRDFIHFDTAYMYHDGQSEKATRETLVKRYDRSELTLTTKLPSILLKSEGDQERVFEEQLGSYGMRYFDYYLLHNLNVSYYEAVRRLDSFAFV